MKHKSARPHPDFNPGALTRLWPGHVIWIIVQEGGDFNSFCHQLCATSWELDKGFEWDRIDVPSYFVGRTVMELNLRNRLGATAAAVYCEFASDCIRIPAGGGASAPFELTK